MVRERGERREDGRGGGGGRRQGGGKEWEEEGAGREAGLGVWEEKFPLSAGPSVFLMNDPSEEKDIPLKAESDHAR